MSLEDRVRRLEGMLEAALHPEIVFLLLYRNTLE
jgi:hypothetical protein